MDVDDLIIDFDEPRERANFRRTIDALSGKKRVTIRNYRKSRSGAQNRYLWGVVYKAFVEFRHGQGEEFDSDMAHHFFGLKFLRQTVVNMETGEAMGTTVTSTTKLNVSEFAVYVDKIIAFMADYGIEVPPPDRDYRERAA